MHPPMFIATLFTTARTWKQSKCPSADEWVEKTRYIHTTEYIYILFIHKKKQNWVISIVGILNL